MHTAPLAVAEPNLSQRPVLRVGVTVGASLCFLLLGWMFVANRIPFFYRFAQVRNLITEAIAIIMLLIPVFRFPRSPIRLLVSALVGWTMLSLTYSIMEIRFPGLQSRIGAFHVFVLGAIAYGLLAAVLWVGRCVTHACQYPIVSRRRTP